MLRFDYLISPIVNNHYYTPSSLAGLSVQDNIISIYLKKNPSTNEINLFEHIKKKYINFLIPKEKFLKNYKPLAKKLDQAHFKMDNINYNALNDFLHDLITYDNDYHGVVMMNFELREQIMKEFKKVYRNDKLIGHLKSSNHPLYSTDLHTMPTLTEHAECLTVADAKGCPLPPTPVSTPSSLVTVGVPVASAIAISSLIFYSFYRCLKRNPKKKSSEKLSSYHYTV